MNINAKCRIIALVIASTAASAALAMPTKGDFAKAQPIVNELMNPLVKDFKANKTTAAEVGAKAVEYAREAETEAAKFMLLKGAISYYARAAEYDKAADAVDELGRTVKNIPPDTMLDIISRATSRINEGNAPDLFAWYRFFSTRAQAEKEIAKLKPLIAKRPADDTLRRRYAEALAASGNWKAALDEFAKVKGALGEIATADKSGKGKAGDIAEFWWGYKPEEQYVAESMVIKWHAAEFYKKALADGSLSGLKKTLAGKRISEANQYFGKLLPTVPNPGPTTPVLAPPSVPHKPAATDSGKYCVIDVSKGPNASKYDVTYLSAEPKGGWTDEYKTTKLVLRRIEPGKFKMLGKCDVILTKPFYCGIFEVTQKQYELVKGDNPSKIKGDMLPVTDLRWGMIRGDTKIYDWPNIDDVDARTFVGRIQARTGLKFDLPTEAQWEYACRAGTTSTYNNGGDSVDDLRKLGRFRDNQNDGKGGEEGCANVGMYQPNAWGLYDMHGNAWEWCLDWYGGLTEGVTDPVGPFNGSGRAIRGGSWHCESNRIGSGRRDVGCGDSTSYGFRLFLTLSNERPPKVPSPGPTTPPAAPPVVAQGSGVWALPKTFQTPLERSLDLGRGVSMPFCACPAGTFMMLDHKVTITRPFWFTKTPVTLKQHLASPPEGYRHSFPDLEIAQKINKEFMETTIIPYSYNHQDLIACLNSRFKRILPPGYVFRFPTEAEFYYAWHAKGDDLDEIGRDIDAGKRARDAFVQRGWVSEGDKHTKYDWANFAELPEPNAFGIQTWRTWVASYAFLDTINVKGQFEGEDKVKAVLQYADEEVDPLRMTGVYRLASKGARHVRAASEGNWGCLCIVIGPDLNLPELDRDAVVRMDAGIGGL